MDPDSDNEERVRVNLEQFLTDASIRKKLEEFDATSSEDEEIDPRTIKSPTRRLLYSAETNHVDMIREILDANPEFINVQDDDGYSPLHRASYNNHISVAQELINRGADIRMRTKDGWEPLHSACRWNSVQVASVLLHNGADVNSQTNSGLTPLHLAASDRNARILISLLLSQPCIDLTIKDNAGETAFQVARRHGPHSDLFDTAILLQTKSESSSS